MIGRLTLWLLRVPLQCVFPRERLIAWVTAEAAFEVSVHVPVAVFGGAEGGLPAGPEETLEAPAAGG